MKTAIVSSGEGKIEEAVGLLFRVIGTTFTEEAWKDVKQQIVDQISKQVDVTKATEPAVKITMPCGEVLIIRTLDDVLALEWKDIPCLCGDPTHWFIKCEEERNN